MPVDASIYSEFKPTPIVNPLAVLMQLRGQTAEIQLHQAQAEHARQQAAQETLITQQKQRQLRDESTLKEMMADPIIGPRIAGGDVSPLNGRVDYAFQQQIAKNAEEVHKNAALASKDDLENRASAYSGLAQGLNGLGEDPTTINERVQAFKTSPANAMLFKNAGIDPSSIPVVNDVNDLKKWEASIGIAQAVNDKALALKKAQGDIANTTAEAGLRTSEAREHNATAGIKEAELAAMSSAPGTAEDKVAGIIDPQKYPKEYAAYLSQYKSAVKLEDKTAVLKEAQGEMSKIREATNPEIRAGKVADAVAIAKGTNPIIQGRELTVAEANRQAAEHVTAQGEYEKSLEALNTAVSDAVRIHNLIAAAQGGNKAAPALVPIAELRTFITRPNIAELRSVGGAGSALDTIEGWVKGKTEGQPIPPDVLKATDELSALAIAQAQQKHAGSVTAINTARHENFKPATAADLGYTAPGAGVPTPATQAEFNALPKGAKFKKPNDQTVYTKQ